MSLRFLQVPKAGGCCGRLRRTVGTHGQHYTQPALSTAPRGDTHLRIYFGTLPYLVFYPFEVAVAATLPATIPRQFAVRSSQFLIDVRFSRYFYWEKMREQQGRSEVSRVAAEEDGHRW